MPLFSFGVQLCLAHTCSACRKSDMFLNSSVAAERWLAGVARDPLIMMSLHQVAVECGYDRLSRLDDVSVIRIVAGKIASGALRACDSNWSSPRFVVAAGPVAEEADDETAKPFPIEERTKPASVAAAPAAAEPSTFANGLNVPAQAHALASAAAQGVPFCPE